MDTPREVQRKRAQVLETAKELLAQVDERDGVMTGDEETQYREYLATADKMKEQIARREQFESDYDLDDDDFEPIEQRSKQSRKAPAHHKRPVKDNAESIFARYVRTGDPGAGREMHVASLEERSEGERADINSGIAETRASNDTIMNISSNADGAYLVPTGHYNRIIARKDESGLAARLPLMNIPGVGTTVNVPIDAEADSEFVATSEQVDAGTNLFDRDAPAVGTKALTLVKYTKVIELTDELMYDNDSNLMQWLEFRVGLGLRKTDNNLIVTEALANGTASTTLGAAAAATRTDITSMVYNQADGYDDSNTWIMRKATLGAYRALTGDDYAFKSNPSGSAGGDPSGTLWDFPVATTGKMPAIGGGNKSIILGDFNYMGVRRVPGLTALVNPYRKQGLLLLEYYYRVVFGVLQAAAITYGTHPTA